MNKKITVDILMFIAIIVEFLSMPILIHEIVGIGLLFLIALHLKYNKRFFKSMHKGKYTLKKKSKKYHKHRVACFPIDNNNFRNLYQPKVIKRHEDWKSQDFTYS